MTLNYVAPRTSAWLAAAIVLISLVFAPSSVARAEHRVCAHERHHHAACAVHKPRHRHATERKRTRTEGSPRRSVSGTTTGQRAVPATTADPLFFAPTSVWNAPLPADARA